MTKLLTRLILAFVFAASTVHAPAIAHEEPVSHHAELTASADDAMTDHHSGAPSSPDGAGDGVHHHHCPTALDTHMPGVVLCAMSGKALLQLQRSAVLTSFSQAPPIEPPSA